MPGLRWSIQTDGVLVVLSVLSLQLPRLPGFTQRILSNEESAFQSRGRHHHAFVCRNTLLTSKSGVGDADIGGAGSLCLWSKERQTPRYFPKSHFAASGKSEVRHLLLVINDQRLCGLRKVLSSYINLGQVSRTEVGGISGISGTMADSQPWSLSD